MSHALKATALSGLLFPGAGQYVLGHRLRASLFIVPTLFAAGFFLQHVFVRAQAIADELVSGRLAFDVPLVLARVHQDSLSAAGEVKFAAGVMIACWVLSLLDAWFLGRRLDATQHAATSSTSPQEAK